MANTIVSIKGKDFMINGQKVYADITGTNPDTHGLLMNARFIQGIFDEKINPKRFNRFGKTFDPEKNTDDLIAALPMWYEYGLRAFTVGIQGGGPCFTTDNYTIDNNPFGEDGTYFDVAYQNRLDRLIQAADKIGMVVIVSFFYGAQATRLKDGKAILNAVRTASKFLKEKGYTNVLIEVANEQNAGDFKKHPLIETSEGVVALMELAREASGGLLVGCSGIGNYADPEICRASDIVIIHGNGCSRQSFYKLIQKVSKWAPNRPIICNEDSQAIGNIEVGFKTHCSWGYYNNMTKQEPPTDWTITKGEDQFFAYRMAKGIGLEVPEIPQSDMFYLQGFEKDMAVDACRWIRVASLYPESINYVDFYINDTLIYTCYDEPFSVNFESNWIQQSINFKGIQGLFKAVIHLRNGEVIEKTSQI